MNNETYSKLRKMRLPEFADRYRKQSEEPELYRSLTFDERLTLLVDAEYDARTNNKIKNRFLSKCPIIVIYLLKVVLKLQFLM